MDINCEKVKKVVEELIEDIENDAALLTRDELLLETGSFDEGTLIQIHIRITRDEDEFIES